MKCPYCGRGLSARAIAKDVVVKTGQDSTGTVAVYFITCNKGDCNKVLGVVSA